jgi:putative phosphoserine phosphatase/1-acylglycerol-3-phosphate O-acyltransferase
MGRSAKPLTDFNAYLARVQTLPRDERVVAFFDLDRTLIAGYSIAALALEKMWSGSLSPRRILAHAGIFLHWGLGRSDYHQLLEGTVQGLVGMSEAEITELGERAFERRLKPLIYAEARHLIDAHKRAGHDVVIVTSASRYQTLPIARDLEVEHVYCTELEIEAGRITGKVAPCHGPGKKHAADRHAAARGVALMDAFFYSDSCEDLPLLEAVGHPVTANAKSALARIAAARGWPQLIFEQQGGSARPLAA